MLEFTQPIVASRINFHNRIYITYGHAQRTISCYAIFSRYVARRQISIYLFSSDAHTYQGIDWGDGLIHYVRRVDENQLFNVGADNFRKSRRYS